MFIIIAALWVFGVAALIRGVAMVSPPAAWIVFGVVLMTMALWPLIRGVMEKPNA